MAGHDRATDRCAIADAIGNDLVRGVVATDALIGTFARLDDPSLQQNVCFLYHLLGGGVGDWHVPVGGMGSVSAALAAAAVRGGAEIVTGAEVYAVDRTAKCATAGRRRAPWRAADSCWQASHPRCWPACWASNHRRRPRRSGQGEHGAAPAAAIARRQCDARAGFRRNLHVNETWTQLDTAYLRAAAGALPDPLPCEIYCHSLTDPSILSPALRESGAQTLAVFGLHTPHSSFGDDEPTRCAARSPEPC